MKKVKGCLNPQCSEYKKTYYTEDDEFCIKCGTKLSFVCKYPKCFKQIPDDAKDNLCPVHRAEKQDKKEKRGDAIKKIGGGILAVGGLAIAAGKAAIDIIKKK